MIISDLPAQVSVGASLGAGEPEAGGPLQCLRGRFGEAFLDSEILAWPGTRVLGLLEPGALHQGVAGLLAGRQLAVVVVGCWGTAHIFIEPLDLNRTTLRGFIGKNWEYYLRFREHLGDSFLLLFGVTLIN